MDGPYADHVLDAKDVCANCYRLVRVERIDPTKAGFFKDYQKRYERERRNTEISYGPGDCISEHKGVFCKCGVEGVYPSDRYWGERVGVETFKDFISNCYETLSQKGVSVDRERFVETAIVNFHDGASVDESLSDALDTGLAVAGAKSETEATA